MPQFFLLLIVIAATLSMLLVCIGGFLIAFRLGAAIVDKIRFKQLRRMVIKDPRRGSSDGEGNFVYKQGRFTILYRLIDGHSRAPLVKFLSQKRRLWAYEQKAREFKRAVRDFWLYRDWEHFFSPRVFIPTILIILVLYFAVFEPLGSKVNRLQWVIANIVGLPIKSVTIEPGGYVAISGQRRPASDNRTEGWSYYVNPLKWFVFSDGGFVIRDRQDTGRIAYPVKYDTKGAPEIKKEGTWLKGDVKGSTVNWENPQGTVVRSQTLTREPGQGTQETIAVKDK
jgi:hypothetical protein